MMNLIEHRVKFYGGYKSKKIVTHFSAQPWRQRRILIRGYPSSSRIFYPSSSRIFRPTLPPTFRRFCAENAARRRAELSGKIRRKLFEKFLQNFRWKIHVFDPKMTLVKKIFPCGATHRGGFPPRTPPWKWAKKNSPPAAQIFRRKMHVFHPKMTPLKKISPCGAIFGASGPKNCPAGVQTSLKMKKTNEK